METNEFSEPIRQSSKGIIIIFGVNCFQFVKRFFVLFIAFGVSLFRKSSFANLSPTILVLILIGIVLLVFVYAVLKYLNFKFHLVGEDFHLSTGILNKDNTIIPKSKIQNVYIKQNFLQQIINVVSLKIETAGDNKSEIEINALDKPKALRLKKLLFSKRTTDGVGSEVNDEEVDDVFFRASVKRLLLEGISQNHIKSFAIIASFVFGLYYEFEDFLVEFGIGEQIENAVSINEESVSTIMISIIFITIFVLLISMVFSVVRTFIVNFNLEVVEHQKTVEINKGLFNKISLSLTPSRIQNLVIKTNRLKKYLGLYTLSVKQAMTDKKQQKNFVIVALEREQLNYLVNRFLSDYSLIKDKYKPENYYLRILALDMFILTFILHIPAVLVFGYNFWILTLVMLPFMAIYIFMVYRKAYYSVSDNAVTIGSGFIDTTTNILEIHKIQAVKLKQSIFQKRRRIASVVISTASKSVTISYVKEGTAKNIYDYLLFLVESQDRDWM
ncbi:PH domain-containing protein [Winogradskyella ursingii]|uniref:PH domain-containing protein n=1 Tax=Winogradskyella ursingii TaxID=2686079 RepID=UPI0015C85B8E|nr:PH domain-containing protein [Winogradskyella ursingii]